jgi:hypothetical protein
MGRRRGQRLGQLGHRVQAWARVSGRETGLGIGNLFQARIDHWVVGRGMETVDVEERRLSVDGGACDLNAVSRLALSFLAGEVAAYRGALEGDP